MPLVSPILGLVWKQRDIRVWHLCDDGYPVGVVVLSENGPMWQGWALTRGDTLLADLKNIRLKELGVTSLPPARTPDFQAAYLQDVQAEVLALCNRSQGEARHG